MLEFSKQKKEVAEFMDQIAPRRDKWVRFNRYYYKDLLKLLTYCVPEKSSVLEVGCGTGCLLKSLHPQRGVGIDISPEMIRIASEKYPHLEFREMDAENVTLDETFEFVVLSDTLGYLEDIQRAFKELKKVSNESTRIIITYHNFLWEPALRIAEVFRLKMPHKRLNWLNENDITSLLALEDFEIVKKGRRFLFPKYVPILSWIFNRYLAHLPLLNYLCITGYVVARKRVTEPAGATLHTVSVVIPARNERGNIENAIRRMPRLGTHTEIIFVEGHSTDGTLEEIQRVCEKYSADWDMRYCVQDGKGKGDAVRKGFAIARGDVLLILDADLTMPPEELPKFYEAIATGKGEYINGSRLVYPVEKEAMRILNMIANKFFSGMFTWLLGQSLKDTLCGTKVISKQNYEKLIVNRGYFGDFDPFGDFDLIFGSSRLNLKIVEIPIRYRAREYGETNISRFSHGWLLLKMVLFAMNKVKFI